MDLFGQQKSMAKKAKNVNIKKLLTNNAKKQNKFIFSIIFKEITTMARNKKLELNSRMGHTIQARFQETICMDMVGLFLMSFLMKAPEVLIKCTG